MQIDFVSKMFNNSIFFFPKRIFDQIRKPANAINFSLRFSLNRRTRVQISPDVPAFAFINWLTFEKKIMCVWEYAKSVFSTRSATAAHWRHPKRDSRHPKCIRFLMLIFHICRQSCSRIIHGPAGPTDRMTSTKIQLQWKVTYICHRRRAINRSSIANAFIWSMNVERWIYVRGKRVPPNWPLLAAKQSLSMQRLTSRTHAPTKSHIWKRSCGRFFSVR